MKKHLWFILLFFFVCHCNAFSQAKRFFPHLSNEADIIKQNLVTKEIIYQYTLNKNAIRDSIISAELFYDDLGNIREERLAKNDIFASITRKYNYYYNDSGYLYKKVIITLPSRLVSIIEYDYDKAGNEINRYDYNHDTTQLTVQHKVYNKNNQLIELYMKINSGEMYLSKRYYYNDSNQLVREDIYDKRNQILYSYIYEYDKSLNKKSVYLQNSDGKNLNAEYFYNNLQQLVRIHQTFSKVKLSDQSYIENSGLTHKTETAYNSDKTIYEVNFYVDNKRMQMNRHYYFKDQ